jgi:hypothetical protein
MDKQVSYTWRDANRINWAVEAHALDTSGDDWTWSYTVIREHDTSPTTVHSGVLDGQCDQPPGLRDMLELWQSEVTTALLGSWAARRGSQPDRKLVAQEDEQP